MGQPHGDRAERRTKVLALIASCGGVGLVWWILTSTGATAPAIGLGLKCSQLQLQWINDIYPLALSTLLLPAGSFLDGFGRKRGMTIGLVILVGSSLWAAFAPSADVLIAARTLSGVGAALVFPATLATLSGIFGDEDRARAIAYWGIGIVVGGGLGLVGTPLLLEVASWGAAFLIMAGFSLVCLVLTIVALPESKGTERTHRRLARCVVVDPRSRRNRAGCQPGTGRGVDESTDNRSSSGRSGRLSRLRETRTAHVLSAAGSASVP